MKKILIAIAVVVSALAVGACGGGTTTVIKNDSASSTPATTTDSINQETADWLATTTAKEFSTVCSMMRSGFPREQTEKLGAKYLGPLIIQRGADVEETVSLLLDKC